MKELLKKLAEEHRALKAARKTGPYKFVAAPYGGWDYDALRLLPAVKASWEAASKVQQNALYITVALNLYHEKRGSDYRHNIPDHLKHSASRLAEEINKLVNELEKVK